MKRIDFLFLKVYPQLEVDIVSGPEVGALDSYSRGHRLNSMFILIIIFLVNQK